MQAAAASSSTSSPVVATQPRRRRSPADTTDVVVLEALRVIRFAAISVDSRPDGAPPLEVCRRFESCARTDYPHDVRAHDDDGDAGHEFHASTRTLATMTGYAPMTCSRSVKRHVARGKLLRVRAARGVRAAWYRLSDPIRPQLPVTIRVGDGRTMVMYPGDLSRAACPVSIGRWVGAKDAGAGASLVVEHRRNAPQSYIPKLLDYVTQKECNSVARFTPYRQPGQRVADVAPDVWTRGGLGQACWVTYRRLTEEPQTTAALAVAVDRSRDTVRKRLKKLAQHGMATRDGRRWTRGPATELALAKRLGVDGSGERRRIMFTQQQRAWAQRAGQPTTLASTSSGRVVDLATGEVMV